MPEWYLLCDGTNIVNLDLARYLFDRLTYIPCLLQRRRGTVATVDEENIFRNPKNFMIYIVYIESDLQSKVQLNSDLLIRHCGDTFSAGEGRVSRGAIR